MVNNLVKRETYNIGSPYQAKKVAVALTKFIKENKLSVNIQGHDYAMVEGWQFAGGLMGLFPQITEVKEIAPMKWMAKAEIINVKTDKIVGVGYAICSKDEMKKKSFDEYAILSMAQTRAIGKAFRNYIGWVIKMAGYEGTPAEEAPKNKTTEPEESRKEPSLVTLKKLVFKAGAKDEKEALNLINEKCGLKLTDLKLSEKHAEIVLFNWLKAK